MQSKANELQIFHVPPCLISPLWGSVSAFIRRGAEVAGADLKTTLERLFEGVDGLWMITQGAKVLGAFVTTICDESGRRFVGVSNLSGEKPSLWAQKMCDLMADYARDQGCGFVRCYGRKAWGRVLNNVSITGELENGHAIFERAVL